MSLVIIAALLGAAGTMVAGIRGAQPAPARVTVPSRSGEIAARRAVRGA